MIHTRLNVAKKRSNTKFDSVSSTVCQFAKSAPSIPAIDVTPIEGDPYKIIRYTFGASFITIRSIGKGVEISVHSCSNYEVPNDYFCDHALVAELKTYLTKSLKEVKWRIKQDRSRA